MPPAVRGLIRAPLKGAESRNVSESKADSETILEIINSIFTSKIDGDFILDGLTYHM